MRTSSAGKVLSRTAARNCFLINQLATPGLGSLMGRRYIAGTGQLLLALIGAGFVIAWFVALMKQMVQAIDGNGVPHPVGWLVEVGGGLLVIAWFWALFTSLSLQRDARDSEPPPIPPQ